MQPRHQQEEPLHRAPALLQKLPGTMRPPIFGSDIPIGLAADQVPREHGALSGNAALGAAPRAPQGGDLLPQAPQVVHPVGSDLRAGLITSPTLCFLEQNAGHDVITDILTNGRQDDASIREAVDAIRESGAIESSLDEAHHFVRNSQRALENLPSSEYRDALWELADFVVERNR